MAAKSFSEVLKADHQQIPPLNVPEEPKEDAKKSFSIFKSDDDKRLVFGWASISITVEGEQLEDRQKDIIDPEDLEEAAYEYVLNFRDTGEEHISTMRKKGKLVESCVFTAEKQKAMGIPEGILPIGWWIGFKIDDDDAWARVKNGTYRMFSIEGKANREPVEKGQPVGCGVLVVQGDKVLAGTRIERSHRGQICGPGGHIEEGETPEQAAKREAREEFGITCKELTPLGRLKSGRSEVFLCTKFTGTPSADDEEMADAEWYTIDQLRELDLYPAFEESLEMLEEASAPAKTVAKTFSEVLKANPYHDNRGRFTTAGGGGGLKITYNSIEAQAVKEDSKAASYLMYTGMPFDEIMTAYNNGTVIDKAKEAIDRKYNELQKRYDSATPGQRKLMEMTPEEVADFIKECQEAETPKNLNTASTTQRVIHQLGMHEKPTVLAREEYEEAVKNSPSGKIYRGVQDNKNAGVTADEIAEMTVNGDQTFIGYGIHSDGIYFSTKIDTAAHFTGHNGAAVEACINPKARVADYNELSLERTKDPQGYTISDMGTYALHKGYNAIKVPADASEDYYIALDRSALVFPTDYKVNISKPEEIIYLPLLNKAHKTINGEELGRTFNDFAFQSRDKNKKIAKTFDEVLKFNPFHDAKGRFSSSDGFATYSANPKTKAGAMAISRSAQAGHGTTFNSHKESQGENITQNYKWLNGGPGAKQLAAQGQLASQQAKKPPAPPPKPAAPPPAPPKPAPPPKPTKNFDSRGFADQDDADFHQLYNRKQYYQQQNLTQAQKKAADQYIDPTTEPGSLYNVAQNLNHAMVQGQKLSTKHKKVHDELMGAMHNVGYNIKATRYDHDGMINSVLNSLGAGSDYTKLSGKQLKKALVGKPFGENKFISTSVNDLGKAPQNVQRLFKDRAVKVTYNIKANAKGLLMPIGSGGDQGEMILAPTNGKANSTPKIKDVRYTGKTVYRTKTGRSYPQIELVVEFD